MRVAKEVQKVRIQELDAWIVKFSDLGSNYLISYLVRSRSIKVIIGLQERAQRLTNPLFATELFATETVVYKGLWWSTPRRSLLGSRSLGFGSDIFSLIYVFVGSLTGHFKIGLIYSLHIHLG